jgi:hypothetical protein
MRLLSLFIVLWTTQPVFSQSEITDVWLTGFINGYWYYPDERITYWRDRFLKKGISAHIFHVPLGHPFRLSSHQSSGALGIEGEIPNITPKHWKKRTSIDGSINSGVSIHSPVVEENTVFLQLKS